MGGTPHKGQNTTSMPYSKSTAAWNTASIHQDKLWHPTSMSKTTQQIKDKCTTLPQYSAVSPPSLNLFPWWSWKTPGYDWPLLDRRHWGVQPQAGEELKSLSELHQTQRHCSYCWEYQRKRTFPAGCVRRVYSTCVKVTILKCASWLDIKNRFKGIFQRKKL